MVDILADLARFRPGAPPPAEAAPRVDFPITSRYHGIETATLETPGGQPVAYLRRRFLPQPERFVLLREHVVTQGERLDRIAHTYIGDAEQWWRIADANAAMHPAALVATIGRRLRITLPEGVPGPSDG
jgi:hypothetical protein